MKVDEELTTLLLAGDSSGFVKAISERAIEMGISATRYGYFPNRDQYN